MRILGNILWHIPFMGFMTALCNFVLGVILTITVIGAPLGLGLLQLARFQLTPFSHEMIDNRNLRTSRNRLWDAYGFLVRIIYFPFGLIIALINIIQITLMFFSIIGIPVALVLAKSLGTYFNPVNKICVRRSVAVEIESRRAEAQADQYMK